MSNLKELDKAQEMFDSGEKIVAIKHLRQHNPGLDLIDARCAVDSKYAAKIENRKRNAQMVNLFAEFSQTLHRTKVFILHVKEHGYDLYAQALAQNLLEEVRLGLNGIAVINMEKRLS